MPISQAARTDPGVPVGAPVDAGGVPNESIIPQLRTRERRLMWMSILYLGVVFWVYRTAQAAWWVLRAPNVTAGGDNTLLLTPGWLAVHGAIPSLMGVPQPVALAVLAAGIGAASLLCRSALLGAVALGAEVITWHSLTAAVLAIQGANGAVAQVSGIHHFETAVAVGFGLLVMTTFELAWINHHIRVESQALAAANAKSAQPSLLDVLAIMHMPRLASTLKHADKQHKNSRIRI